MTYPNERDCEHGQLRRSCNICDYENDIKALKTALDLIAHTRFNDAKVNCDNDDIYRIATEAIKTHNL